jgi:hypothetical protein
MAAATAEKPLTKNQLLAILADPKVDQMEKRKVRAKLRKLGHSGGLGEKRGVKKTAPAGRRANAAPVGRRAAKAPAASQ